MTTASPEQFTFQAEIKQLLNILSHSLYQNREIAIRELLSNASDSLNKLRHIQLTEEQYRDDVPLEIVFEPDAEAKILTIRDYGLGLTHDELVQNLGTIARSGSKEFLNQLQGDAKNSLELIGQFGVGFYSAFMLADKVEVVTRSYREPTGWRWNSDGSGQFTIEAVEGELPRGAQIRLHLKPDMEEFLEPERLKYIVRKYSTFIPHPIQLNGEQLNEQRPIWVEPKSQLTEEQYNGFYQWLTHRGDEKPLWHLHLSSDSPLQFHAILYCPRKNFELLGFGRDDHGLNLCAKRILVQDNNQDLLPDYLHFLYGVVDSADLPLNVSRETLQDHKLIPKLKKVLTRKTLDFLADLATEKPDDYRQFYQEFGSILRVGISEDYDNRERIAKLMRFYSSNGEDRQAVTSLDDYLLRAAEGQEQIYYLSGSDLNSIQNHPHLESFKKRNLEVLFLIDPVDEYALSRLHKYQDKEIVSVDSADVKFPSSRDAAVADSKELPNNFQRVVELFCGSLDDRVTDVRKSDRLTDSPCCLINPEGSVSSQLQKVLRQNGNDFPAPKRLLELNPHAALITRLCELAANSENDDFIRQTARQLHATAELQDGLVSRPDETAKLMQSLLEDLAKTKTSIIL